jgi:hypothetical protein
MAEKLPETVTLIGGPLDGEIVPFLGVCHERYASPRVGTNPRYWARIIYTWAMDGERIVGNFAGYRQRKRPTRAKP